MDLGEGGGEQPAALLANIMGDLLTGAVVEARGRTRLAQFIEKEQQEVR